MNRFLDRGRRYRIAAVVTHGYPVADQAHVYAELERLGECLDADVQVFHSRVADPRTLPPELKARVGAGVLVPSDPLIHAADADHFRRVAPTRVASLMRELTSVTGKSAAELLDRRDVKRAFSYARLVQAWAPDVVYCHNLHEHTQFALASAHLLDIPWVLAVSWAGDRSSHASLAPLFIEKASLIGAGSAGQLRTLVDRFGEGVRAKATLRAARGSEIPPLTERVRDMLSRPRASDSPALGPRGAFVTEHLPPVDLPASVKPFIVLGAERTGSNMLLDALAAYPEIACAGELFNSRFILDGNVPWIPGAACDRDELIRLRAADPADLHARLLTDGARRGAACVGFKLLYAHGAAHNRIVDRLAAIEGLKVVHLVRSDRLRRWLSHYKADLFDSWYTSRRSAHEEAGPLALDPMATVMDFAYVELMEERYRAVFAGADVIELEYEKFSADLTRTGRQLSEFLGVNLGALKPMSKKTGTRPLQDAIANLADLRETLTGTRWALPFDGSSARANASAESSSGAQTSKR